MSINDLDYKALFARAPVPSFIIRLESGDRLVLIDSNEKADALLKSAEGKAGKALDNFLDEHLYHAFLESLQKARNEKRAGMIQESLTLEDETRLSGFLVTPLSDEDPEGPIFHVSGIPATHDADSLQRERDDALSLLTSVFDVSEVGIVVTDDKQHIIRVNDSFVRIYGWKREELIDHEFIELITPDEREQARRAHEEFMRSGIRSSGEMKLIRKDGNVANALFTTAALELSQGRRFQVTTIMDITLRKQMEMSLRLAKEQADAANQAKSTFLANMSHELRTPLNAIIGFSEMMIKGTYGPLGNDKYQEYMSDIHLSAKHLLEIINEVLDMSKIEAGRVELDEEYIDLAGLISSVTRMMVSRAFSSGLTIEEDVQEGLDPLFADPRLVRQILINLVGNAVKYSQTNGVITVRAYKDDGGALDLVVEDTGVGIPKDRIKEAMEPFGQVSIPDQHHTMQGTGLGLPLAKAMAELHGGKLAISSDLGKGTKVTITFPPSRMNYADPRQNKSPFEKFKKSNQSELAQKAD